MSVDTLVQFYPSWLRASTGFLSFKQAESEAMDAGKCPGSEAVQKNDGCARSLDEQMHRAEKATIFSSIVVAYIKQLSCLLGTFLLPVACSVLAEIAAPTIRNVMRLALLPADLRNSAFKSEIYVFRCQLRGIECSLSLLRCTQW
jgi:hypothetical protein